MNMDKERKTKASRDAYAANKEKINKRRRELYAAKKDYINKRRREQYTEKKKFVQCSEITSEKCSSSASVNLPKESSTSTNENVNSHPMNPILEKISSTMNNRSSLQVEPDVDIISAIVQPYLGSSTRRNLLIANVTEQDSRTLVLPKVSSCKHCRAYKFYRETYMFCCSGGEVCLAESVLPDYMVDLVTSTDTKSRDLQNMIRTYNNHFAFTSIDSSITRLLVVLVAFDETSTTKIVAIDQVAERILQTTAQDMSRSVGLGEKPDLESIKHGIENKNLLTYQRRKYGRNATKKGKEPEFSISPLKRESIKHGIENKKLLTYQRRNYGRNATKKGKELEFSISQLKRQMSQIMLTSEGKSKKLLFSSEHDKSDCHTSEIKTKYDI